MKCTTLGVTTALASAAAGTVGTKYAAARTGTLAATADLYGASSAQHAAVDRAQPAVK